MSVNEGMSFAQSDNIRMSTTIGLLATSLSKFQGEITNTVKSKNGYNYSYADLASVLDSVRPVLSENKLSVSQFPGTFGEHVSVETILMHESGEWIAKTLKMPVERGKGMSAAQAYGCVISYARRYALASILGIAQSDNDASIESDDKSKEKFEQKQSKSYTDKKNNCQASASRVENSEVYDRSRSILSDLILDLKVDQQEIDGWIKKANDSRIKNNQLPDVTGIPGLTSTQVSALIDMLTKRGEG